MARITLEFCNAILYHVGNRDHEIPLLDVSSRELKYLRSVHGAENIPGERVTTRGERDVDEEDPVFNIARKDGSREDMEKQEHVVKRLEKLFNVELGDFHQWLDQVTQAEEEQRTSAGRTRAAEANLYARKREDEIRAEAEAKVRAEIAKGLGMTVEEVAVLARPSAQAMPA